MFILKKVADALLPLLFLGLVTSVMVGFKHQTTLTVEEQKSIEYYKVALQQDAKVTPPLNHTAKTEKKPTNGGE